MKIQADAEAPRKRNTELTGEVREPMALALMVLARVKASSQELVSVKSKLGTSRVKSANSQWNTRSSGWNASKGEEDVSNALLAVSEKSTNSTKRDDFVIELDLKNALKRVSTRIVMELQPASSCTWMELARDESEVL